MDPTIVSVTNVGRRKCIALFEDLSYKIEKVAKTHRFSLRKFDTPVALRGPRNPNGEDLSCEITVCLLLVRKFESHGRQAGRQAGR